MDGFCLVLELFQSCFWSFQTFLCPFLVSLMLQQGVPGGRRCEVPQSEEGGLETLNRLEHDKGPRGT